MTTEHNKYDRDTFEHGGIFWGAKIDAANDGKPLPWLKDDEQVFCHWGEETCGGPYHVDCVHGWGDGFKIRLPADHFAYTAIAEGFEPWGGGENPPADWDGDANAILYRDGKNPDYRAWVHFGSGPDIIGYKRKVDAAQYTVPAPDIAPQSTPEHSPKTLRDEFAMAALAGLAAGHYPLQAAVLAYEFADEMMEARK